MSTNSRFAMSVHILALLAQAERPMSSTAIAESVNTNPVTIRKVLGSLSCADLISTQMGADGGAVLMRQPEKITLLDVYHATNQPTLFAHHPKPPNQDCRCGQQITAVLDGIFSEAEVAMLDVLRQRTVAQVVRQIE